MAVESNSYLDYSVAATEAYPLISNFSHWLKPQIGKKLWDVNPVETDFGDFMKMGLMERVYGEEIIHHEANSRFDVPAVAQSATQGLVWGTQVGGSFAGYQYVVLATASHSPETGPNARTKSYPRPGMHIHFKNGGEWRIQGIDTSVPGSHRLFLTKVNASVPDLLNTITLAAGIWGGDIFILPNSSWAEATLGMGEGLVPTSKAYTSYLQTFSEQYTVTDIQGQNETYPLEWNGQLIKFTYIKGINDTEIRFGAQIDNGLFLQNKDDGSLFEIDRETGAQLPITTTQGYIQTLESAAQKLYYDTTPTLALFDNINRYRRKFQQGGNAMLWCGYEFRNKLEGIVKQLGVQGCIVYDQKDVDLNIDTFRKGTFTYHAKDLKILNHPKFAGAFSQKYPFYFVVAPMQMENDPKSNTLMNPFTVVYKETEGEGARGYYKIWEDGANAHGGVAKGRRMNRVILMYAHMGMKTVAAAKHILGKQLLS